MLLPNSGETAAPLPTATTTTDHLTELESLRRLLASQRETIETQKAYIELLKSKT